MTADLSKLTDEEKRVKLAEFCGWTRRHIQGAVSDFMMPPENAKGDAAETRRHFLHFGEAIGEPIGVFATREGETQEECFTRYNVPDYINSLDTIAEVEVKLSNEQHAEFRDVLMRIVRKENLDNDASWQHGNNPVERAYLSATARQRADAILMIL